MRNDRPVIGVLGSHDGGELRTPVRYLNALWQGGALGAVLPYTTDAERIEEYVNSCDGFFFSGGVDVDPVRYGETKRFDSVEIDDARDAFEFAMFPAVYRSGKPVLGICRGIQSINVALGGTLYQHIEGHRQTVPGTERPQLIRLTEGTPLYEICGKRGEIYVNSFHHQNVKDLAPGLVADGVSEDGYIEAFHDPRRRFLLAVQFHPEIYCSCGDDDHAGRIFRAFAEACTQSGLCTQ